MLSLEISSMFGDGVNLEDSREVSHLFLLVFNLGNLRQIL